MRERGCEDSGVKPIVAFEPHQGGQQGNKGVCHVRTWPVLTSCQDQPQHLDLKGSLIGPQKQIEADIYGIQCTFWVKLSKLDFEIDGHPSVSPLDVVFGTGKAPHLGTC